MQQNSIIEMGSRANVVIRFNADTNINGKIFLKNEPYLFLKDVSIEVLYDSNQKEASINPKNYMSFVNNLPSQIAITGIVFSKKIASLMACLKGEGLENSMTKMETVLAEGNELILADTEADLTKEFFVYDSNYERINAAVNVDGFIESVDIIDGNSYLVFFSSAVVSTKFELVKPHIPYMNIEIQATGNIDKITKKAIMKFDKVALLSNLTFSFIKDETINAPLVFSILDNSGFVMFED